jgi:hypothetical protein
MTDDPTHSVDNDAYGVELDRRLAAEQTLAAVWEVVETYESCGPKQQSTRDVLAAVRDALTSVTPPGGLARAWDEGFDACFNVSGEPVRQNVPNPYRVIPPEVGQP